MNRLTKIVFLCVALLCFIKGVSHCETVDKYYEIKLKYEYGRIKKEYIKTKRGPITIIKTSGNYALEIKSGDQVLDLFLFDFGTENHYDIVDPETGEIIDGGEKIDYTAEKILRIPYYEEAEILNINIYDKKLEKILIIKLRQNKKINSTGDALDNIDSALDKAEDIQTKVDDIQSSVDSDMSVDDIIETGSDLIEDQPAVENTKKGWDIFKRMRNLGGR